MTAAGEESQMEQAMKAYTAWDDKAYEQYTTVVFAPNCREAKKIAFGTDVCEEARYIDVRVKRIPEMDEHYRGRKEADWDDPEDRKALCSLGWRCLEPDYDECAKCPAKECCGTWETYCGDEEGPGL